MANATYIAIPIQAIALPVFLGPASPKPQLNAPVMTKLSAPPSSARPASRMQADRMGAEAVRSDRK